MLQYRQTSLSSASNELYHKLCSDWSTQRRPQAHLPCNCNVHSHWSTWHHSCSYISGHSPHQMCPLDTIHCNLCPGILSSQKHTSRCSKWPLTTYIKLHIPKQSIITTTCHWTWSNSTTVSYIPKQSIITTACHWTWSNSTTVSHIPKQSIITTACHWTWSNSTTVSHIPKSWVVFSKQSFIYTPLSCISTAYHTHLPSLDSNHPTKIQKK